MPKSTISIKKVTANKETRLTEFKKPRTRGEEYNFLPEDNYVDWDL